MMNDIVRLDRGELLKSAASFIQVWVIEEWCVNEPIVEVVLHR